MIDNVKFKQPITQLQHEKLLKYLSTLKNVSHTTFDNSGNIVTTAHIDDCTFNLSPNNLTVSLSLPKFLYGTNQSNVTRRDTALALLKLQDLIDIDISN